MIDRVDRTSPAWLDVSSVLAAILSRAGLEGRELAAMFLWILEMTNGMVMLEAIMPISQQRARARASHGALSERARERYAPILSGMKGLDGDDLFDFVGRAGDRRRHDATRRLASALISPAPREAQPARGDPLMDIERAKILRPVAPPRVIENAYTDDQHRRLLQLVRENGPWPLIVAHHFQSAEELIATTSGAIPEGVTPTLDMFLTPVFRGLLSYGQVCLYPEIQDCFYNPRFLDLVRDYWGAAYAEPDGMLFNIQGPCGAGGAPHLDATRFPRHHARRYARLADEHDVQERLVQALAGAQGAGRHLVLPGHDRRRLQLLARRAARVAEADRGADVGARGRRRERDDAARGRVVRPAVAAQAARARVPLADGSRP